MHMSLILLAISACLILTSCSPAVRELRVKSLDPGRYQANAATQNLCEKDGGIHVYQKVKLQQGRFPTVIPDEKYNGGLITQGVIYGKYRYEESSSSIQSHGYRIIRFNTSIKSIDDDKMIGEMNRYVRQGEPGLPGLICPEKVNKENFINAIFQKEGEQTNPYPACNPGTPEKIHLTPDSPAQWVKRVKIDTSKWPKVPQHYRGINCDEKTQIDGRTRLLFFGNDGNRCQVSIIPNFDQVVCHENGISVLGYQQLPPSSFLLQTFSMTGEMVREVEISDVAKFRDPLLSYRETETSINIMNVRFDNSHADIKPADCYSTSVTKKSNNLSDEPTRRLGPPDKIFRFAECDPE